MQIASILGIATGVQSQMANAAEIGSGIAAIEDGDDRLRPAAMLHYSTSGGFISRFYVYGRDYGPVQERNYLLSLGKHFDIAGKTLVGQVALAALNDVTTISYSDNPDENSSYSSTNVGVGLGIHYNFYSAKNFLCKASWDGHLFPAGAGVIYLANARRSSISVAGVLSF